MPEQLASEVERLCQPSADGRGVERQVALCNLVQENLPAIATALRQPAGAESRVTSVPSARERRMEEALIELRGFAISHHHDLPSHVMLHALTIDIPARIDAVLDEQPQTLCKPTRLDAARAALEER